MPAVRDPAASPHEPSPEDWFGSGGDATSLEPLTTAPPLREELQDLAPPPPLDPSPSLRRRWPRRLALAVVLVVLAVAGVLGALRYVVYGHQVPRLVRQSLDTARVVSSQAGVDLRVGGRPYSAKVPPGEILSQAPPAGRHVRAGTVVTVLVSRGRAPVPVPSGLVGRTVGAAEAVLHAEHFVPSLSTSYDEKVQAGVVVSASPSSGLLAFGGRVALVVSDGPAPRTVPALGGGTWADASAKLGSLRLVPVEQLRFSGSVPAGQVISSSPAADTTGVKVGTSVTVVVSKGPRLVDVPPVAGQPIASAIARLEQTGLQVTEQIGPPFATKASTTDPAPGTALRPGASVTLYVS